MALSADQFAKALIAAGLSSAEEIKTLWSSLPAGTRPKDGETFAKLLIERGALTDFQTHELLSGAGTPLVLIPPGEFLMGSTDEQVAAALRKAEGDVAPLSKHNFSPLADRPIALLRSFQAGQSEIGRIEVLHLESGIAVDAEQHPVRRP